jgi:hypothetical protein
LIHHGALDLSLAVLLILIISIDRQTWLTIWERAVAASQVVDG